MKHRTKTAIMAAAVATTLMATGGIAYANSAPMNQPYPAEQASQGAQFADDELFTALFFASGNAVKPLQSLINDPEYNKLVDHIGGDADVKRTADEVVSRITEEDPDFLARFQTAVSSGDPYEAERGLKDGAKKAGEKLDEIFNEEVEKDPELKEALDNGEQHDGVDTHSPVVVAAAVVAIAVAAGWSVTVAMNYGAAVNVAAAVNVTVKMNLDKQSGSTPTSAETKNQFEEQTANLTRALSQA